MNPNVMWTRENDQTLINYVKEHEALYNVKSKDYRKAQLKQNLWSNIGFILQKSGYDCCKRWAYVRDYYIRRKGKPGTGTGGEASRNRSSLLAFLDNVPTSQRNSGSNAAGHDHPDESDVTEDAQHDNDHEESINQFDGTEHLTRVGCNQDEDVKVKTEERREDDVLRVKKKRKLIQPDEQYQLLKGIGLAQRKPTPHGDSDETDLFFSSMSKIVKKLPRYEQVQLRMQIASLVGNAELRSLTHELRQATGRSITFPEALNDQGPVCYGSDGSSM